MKYNWKLIFAGLLFLVLVAAVFVAYLAMNNNDQYNEPRYYVPTDNTDPAIGHIETLISQSETIYWLETTETAIAQTKTPPAAVPSPTPSPTPSPIATP